VQTAYRQALTLTLSRDVLVVSVSSYEATGPGSTLGVAILPGGGVADPKRSERRGGFCSTIKNADCESS